MPPQPSFVVADDAGVARLHIRSAGYYAPRSAPGILEWLVDRISSRIALDVAFVSDDGAWRATMFVSHRQLADFLERVPALKVHQSDLIGTPESTCLVVTQRRDGFHVRAQACEHANWRTGQAEVTEFVVSVWPSMAALEDALTLKMRPCKACGLRVAAQRAAGSVSQRGGWMVCTRCALVWPRPESVRARREVVQHTAAPIDEVDAFLRARSKNSGHVSLG